MTLHSKLLPRFFLGISIASLISIAADIDRLSQNPTWRALLFLSGSKSDITDKKFFLYEKRDWTPKKELQATIKHYFDPLPTNPDQHPRCRFPARYYWLKRHIDFPNYETIPSFCKDLRKGLGKNNVGSVSIVLASSYLGNPASSFGHAFIKLKHKRYKTDLLDYTINYGAKVPKNENIFRYILRGVFGLYKAHFQDRFFYSQDFVYSSIEKRDLWEYELKLDDKQLLFLQLHLFEILNKDFKYLFFTKNCGYEVAKSIEIVLPRQIRVPYLWYVPKELVYTLSENQMIRKTIYHPALSKTLAAHYRHLSPRLKRAISQNLPANFHKLIKMQLPQNQKRELLEFLLAYYNYKSLQTQKKFQKEKYAIIKERLFLPPSKTKEYFSTPLPPHLTSKLSTFQLLGTYRDFQLEISPYWISPLTYGGQLDHTLKLLDYQQSKNHKKIKFIEVYQFNTQQLPTEESLDLTWMLRLAYERRFHFDLGIGKSYKPLAKTLFYIMPVAIAQSHPKLDFEAGFIFDSEKLRLQLIYNATEHFRAQANYFFTPNFALSQKINSKRYLLGFQLFF